MRKLSFSLWFVLFIILFIVSCRKSDLETPVAETPTSIERFFNLPGSADPRLKAIAQSIRMQEKEHPFLKDFTKRTGWPVWNKVKMVGTGINNVSNRGSSGTDSTTLVYIPFVQDSANIVNSVLAVKLEPSDTAFRILYANNYESFGFDTTTNNTWNARNVFQFFALFQCDIFGHTKFLIKDERLFNTPTDSFTVTLKERDGVAINSRTTDTYSMTQCITTEVCSNPPAPTPSDQPPPEARVNDVFPSCHYVTTCNTYYWGGGTGWTGSGWSGDGSGGGSGSGSWGTTTDCMNTSTGIPVACSPGWVPYDGGPNSQIITADASITDHPEVNCIYQKLMSPDLQYGLKNILASFDNSQIYNVTFKVEDLDVDGRTTYQGNNNFLIRIDETSAYDNTYSRIWLASTFIHEAFHAKLRQKAIELLGTDVIQNWPKNIDDMTLSELATYFQQSAVTTGVWNSVGHDWMVNHIEEMTNSIKEFVETFYPSIYSNVGATSNAYKALALMGLSGSTYYDQTANSIGDAATINALRASLAGPGSNICPN